MAYIDLGCGFTEDHIDTMLRLKELDTPNTLTHVFGSAHNANPFGSTRPSRREASMFLDKFLEGVGRLQREGITTNITFNSTLPCFERKVRSNIFDSKRAQDAFLAFVNVCSEYNVNWIISHPGLIDLMHTTPYRHKVNIIISTIMNVHTLGQMLWTKKRWPLVRRVCPALWKNRDFQWLEQANQVIPLELLANEFCSMGGQECEGLFRQADYQAQSLDIENWHPLKVCTAERKAHPEAWLMARFILPQWIPYYVEKTKVKHYKVTGRTHPAAYLYDVGMKYLTGKADGNLLALWGQLEATHKGVDQAEEQNTALSQLNIPIEDIDIPLKGMIQTCSSPPMVCGVSCNFCKSLFKATQV